MLIVVWFAGMHVSATYAVSPCPVQLYLPSSVEAVIVASKSWAIELVFDACMSMKVYIRPCILQCCSCDRSLHAEHCPTRIQMKANVVWWIINANPAI